MEDEYLTKDDDGETVVLWNSVPAKRVDYFPPQEEQDRVQAEANAKDSRYHMLACQYRKLYPDTPATPLSVALFLDRVCFIDKTRAVIAKPFRKDTRESLVRYLGGGKPGELFL